MQTDISSLIQRVEGLSGPSIDVSGEICIALQYVGPFAPNPKNVTIDNDDPGWLLYELDGEECTDTIPSLTSSIDADLSLVEMMLPGWSWSLARIGHEFRAALYKPTPIRIPSIKYSTAATPAIALTLALLRALHQGGENV